MTGATVSDTNDSAGTDPDNDDLLTVIDDKRFLFHGGGAEKFKQALAEFKRQRDEIRGLIEKAGGTLAQLR